MYNAIFKCNAFLKYFSMTYFNNNDQHLKIQLNQELMSAVETDLKISSFAITFISTIDRI